MNRFHFKFEKYNLCDEHPEQQTHLSTGTHLDKHSQ